MLSAIDVKNAEILKAYEDRHTSPGVPPRYTDEMVLFEGLCEEVKSNGETERFMFDEQHKLEYEKEVNDKIIDRREGLWATNKKTVSYRFSSSGPDRYLQLILGRHTCSHVARL